MGFRNCLVLVLALALMTGFAAGPAAAGKKGGTINIALEKELETLDWYFNTAREGIVLSQHAYDFLIYRDPVTFEHKPLLATSWKWLSDTVLELELRQGVVFHNGAKFSADDVVYILNYAANPDNKVKYWTYVNWIKEVKKMGDYKVQIVTHKPFPPAIEFLSCAMPIYPKDYYAQVGSKGFGVKPIGTGPYKVAEVEPGKKIVLEAFDQYFAGSPKGKPAIKRIVWRTICGGQHQGGRAHDRRVGLVLAHPGRPGRQAGPGSQHQSGGGRDHARRLLVHGRGQHQQGRLPGQSLHQAQGPAGHELRHRRPHHSQNPGRRPVQADRLDLLPYPVRLHRRCGQIPL